VFRLRSGFGGSPFRTTASPMKTNGGERAETAARATRKREDRVGIERRVENRATESFRTEAGRGVPGFVPGNASVFSAEASPPARSAYAWATPIPFRQPRERRRAAAPALEHKASVRRPLCSVMHRPRLCTAKHSGRRCRRRERATQRARMMRIVRGSSGNRAASHLLGSGARRPLDP
jgi:hypothetical protein